MRFSCTPPEERSLTHLEHSSPIDLEIRWQRLISIMDEVDTATVKTSFSTIVGESRDFACILLDTRGASLCQSSFSPPDFCVSITRTSRVMLERFPIDTLAPGDVLVTNDPWIGDGHLPDYFVLTPVFHRDRVVAIMGTVAHVADVGGHPGDIVASDVFTEGIRVPPAKLYQCGEENRLLFEVIGGNCRVPEMVLGDLRAIVGTHRIGARRLVEFLDDERLSDLDALAAEIHGRSEALMRERIERWPDGRYEFGLDIDGYLETVHLHAVVTIDGRDVIVDYAGTSPQVRDAAINCTYNTTRSSTMYPFKCALVPGVPNNEGLFAPIRVRAPERCILNTTFPHPVSARAKTTNNINQVLFGALWPVLGEHAQAGSGSIWPFSVSGRTTEHGAFSVHVLPHGGRGAMRDLDGMVPIAFPHNSAVTPVEVFETQCPVMIGRKALRVDSAGAGRRRGGPGQVMTFRNVGDDVISARVRPDKIRHPAPGLDGGARGAPGRVRFNGRELAEFPILPFAPGDEITLEIPGGAGFGPPYERDRRAIERDVALGYLTPGEARRAYGPALVEETA
jgi:N-methylhydantoinase B